MCIRDRAQGDTSSPDVMDAESQNLSAVRQATDLALDHLRDSIRSTDDEMLKELGWTREQAEAFLQRWDNMQKASENGIARRWGQGDLKQRAVVFRSEKTMHMLSYLFQYSLEKVLGFWDLMTQTAG